MAGGYLFMLQVGNMIRNKPSPANCSTAESIEHTATLRYTHNANEPTRFTPHTHTLTYICESKAWNNAIVCLIII